MVDPEKKFWLRLDEATEDLRSLPIPNHEQLFEDLLKAAARALAVDSLYPIRDFFDRLQLTARLYRTPEYRKALEEAEEEARQEPQRISAADLVAIIRG